MGLMAPAPSLSTASTPVAGSSKDFVLVADEATLLEGDVVEYFNPPRLHVQPQFQVLGHESYSVLLFLIALILSR